LKKRLESEGEVRVRVEVRVSVATIIAISIRLKVISDGFNFVYVLDEPEICKESNMFNLK
jgi:hypothetical protein